MPDFYIIEGCNGAGKIPPHLHSFPKYRIMMNSSKLFNLYLTICDYRMVFDNSGAPSELVAESYSNGELAKRFPDSFNKIKNPKLYDKES